MSFNNIYEKELDCQSEQRRATVSFINIISDLWYDNTIELVLFRNPLMDRSVSEILNLVQYASDFVEKPISIFDAVKVAREIQLQDFPPSKLDIGKLVYEFKLSEKQRSLADFISEKKEASKTADSIEARDVVLYGFGRIGRLLARELMAQTGAGKQMRLRAIVTRGKITPTVLDKRASLLAHDSVHGDFKGTVRVNYDKNALIINGTTVNMISANAPEEIDYTQYGISNALVMDNTGAFRDKEALSRHLSSQGVSKVLLTAPGKGVPNIVHGVNHKEYCTNETNIYSAASCTTNAITPILKVMEDNFGVERGHLETIHAYTNDQNLVDNMHNKYRRGRAAALNMVITETGAGKAVSKALPSLEGKLTSSAIRVPVPNGSLAILNLDLGISASKETVNSVIKKAALEGDLVEQIKFSLNNELVSSDIVGVSAPSIFDSSATIANTDGSNVVLYIWYDNEYGYSHQVMRLAKYISQVRRFAYY